MELVYADVVALFCVSWRIKIQRFSIGGETSGEFSPRSLGFHGNQFDGPHIFQMGWFNHQLVLNHFSLISFAS